MLCAGNGVERIASEDGGEHKSCEIFGSLDNEIIPPSGGGIGRGSAVDGMKQLACLWRRWTHRLPCFRARLDRPS